MKLKLQCFIIAGAFLISNLTSKRFPINELAVQKRARKKATQKNGENQKRNKFGARRSRKKATKKSEKSMETQKVLSCVASFGGGRKSNRGTAQHKSFLTLQKLAQVWKISHEKFFQLVSLFRKNEIYEKS